ncbi:MAG: transcriptional regulator [Acidimicrobiaceae bacterium]|nr:transcriptional regulator [Acidimicrobiaceae bacterium]
MALRFDVFAGPASLGPDARRFAGHINQADVRVKRVKETSLRLGNLHPGEGTCPLTTRRSRSYAGVVTLAPNHAHELGDFLKARRAQLRPQEVGLPDVGSPRKVAGLRREEVAQLAAISVDYLTRLEQGRVQASASVLVTLARALRLDDDQQTYLYQLVGKTPILQRRRAAQKLRPAMRRLLDQLTETPAIVLGRRMDILAWNAGAAALYTDFGQIPANRRNYVRLLFTHPAVRSLHAEWEHDASTAVAALRMEAANDPDDPELAVLVGELAVQDPDFRTWWATHQVTGTGYGTKHYRHSIVGDLTLDCDTWNSPDGSGQRLMVLSAEPGTHSHEGLRILASWAAPAPALQPEAAAPREPS